ncbi:hypothetical protein CMV_004777 [Castanea mollissima]|uniref:Uncharacterized protein n=1 Tax=Castanea mollissima TaxID=60419 RepID=A0A8J4RS65_9ROSI|nr:hypothetical protein CMV_004777 [Castanea mollissima]
MLATTSKRELERERSKGDLSLLSDQMKHGVECFVYEIVLIEYFSGVFQTWASSQKRDANKMLSEVQNRNFRKTSMDSEHMWNR